MTGWGGAGAFSDGKLTLTTEVGGWLGDYVAPSEELDGCSTTPTRMWVEFGATTEVHGPDEATSARLVSEAEAAGMRLVPMRIRHIGTERSPEVLAAMRAALEAAGVTVRTESPVARIVVDDQTAHGRARSRTAARCPPPR